ncbi:hypothetical protein FQR65_LT10385 [Abscondita terminalis]|nr:hypothetical protein FQR65_LT10385 [Abscondita terminalis]
MVDYKIVDNIIYTNDLETNPDPKGIGNYYYSQMIKNKDKIAQVDGYTKEEDSFGSLLQRSGYISLCTNNHLNSAIPFVASYFTGSIMGAIEPTMSVKDATNLLRQTSPKLIFTAPSTVPLVEKIIESIGTETIIVVFGETSQHIPFSKFILPHKNEHDFTPYEPKNLNELSLIVFSSGTSGMPKGICFDHSSMLSLKNTGFALHPEFTFYTIVNPYWSLFPIFFHASVEMGCRRVVYPSFSADDPWTLYYQPVDVAFLNPLQALHLIVNIDTEEILGPNQVGELRIKSPCQFIGYYNKDSSERFDSDGWLRTGDSFYYNEDLCFYFVERIGESFKYLNIHISPAEIETVILDLEPIETAIVIGCPHETEINHPMAVIKLKPNSKKITAEEIVKHVENNLENKNWLRGGVKFVDTIPMTVTGKVNRTMLKKLVLQDQTH